jgi:hypothetical protein
LSRCRFPCANPGRSRAMLELRVPPPWSRWHRHCTFLRITHQTKNGSRLQVLIYTMRTRLLLTNAHIQAAQHKCMERSVVCVVAKKRVSIVRV